MKQIIIFALLIALFACSEDKKGLTYTFKEYRDNPEIQKEVEEAYTDEDLEALDKVKAEYFLADRGKEFLAKSVDDIISEYNEMQKNRLEYEANTTSLDEIKIELKELIIYNEGEDNYLKWLIDAENQGGEKITGFSISMMLVSDDGDTLREDIVRFKTELAPGASKQCESESIQLFSTRQIDKYFMDSGADAVFAATRSKVFSIKLPTKQTEFKIGKGKLTDVEGE